MTFNPFTALPNPLPNPLAPDAACRPDFPCWRPPVEFFQSGAGLFLQVELPGLTPDDFALRFDHGLLTLTGARRFRAEVPADACCFAEEIHYGQFRFELAVHPCFDGGAMESDFEGGMLRVRIPRRARAAT